MINQMMMMMMVVTMIWTMQGVLLALHFFFEVKEWLEAETVTCRGWCGGRVPCLRGW